MEKRVFFLIILVVMMILPLIKAEIKVETNPIIDSIVLGINNSAIYEAEITNLELTNEFRIYSLSGVNIFPNETFIIASGQTKKIKIEAWPESSLMKKPGIFSFVYKIESGSGEIKDDILTFKLIELDEALEMKAYNIDFDSDNAAVYLKNKVSLSFPYVKARFSSSFFNIEKQFPLDAYEKKEFEIPLDKEKIKGLEAGPYVVTAEIEAYGIKAKLQESFRFSEKQDIRTEEKRQGLFISITEIKKINEGNLETLTQIKISKNIISRLFTNFNDEPVRVDRKGFFVTYVFQQEIKPSEIFDVKATTNWLYPLLLIIAVMLIVYLVMAYTRTFIVLRKRATYVKTKGGEFALKISVILKARKFVEKVNVFDKIPSLVKVHERFGINEPDKIDEKNRRLEWYVGSLQQGEERVFSYIIYSKVAPIGKFEVPTATAVYEREGKIHEASSNRVFFLTETRKPEKAGSF